MGDIRSFLPSGAIRSEITALTAFWRALGLFLGAFSQAGARFGRFLACRGSHEAAARESHQKRGQTYFGGILVGLWDFLVHSGGSLGDSGRFWESLGDSGRLWNRAFVGSP